MDGFDPSIGVIVLSATNRPEVLDAALLRPGRFDRRVAVQASDTAGRWAFLAVRTRGMPLADDVELARAAAMTVGIVGADLANVVNEAALMAARRKHPQVRMADLLDALERLVLGTSAASSSARPSASARSTTNPVTRSWPYSRRGTDPVCKVSIIPRGRALGVTLSAPGADRLSSTRSYLEARIAVALGGRVAEELVCGDVSTGAEDDIRHATELARDMVARWGTSEAIGLIALQDEPGAAPRWLGGGAPRRRRCGSPTARCAGWSTRRTRP